MPRERRTITADESVWVMDSSAVIELLLGTAAGATVAGHIGVAELVAPAHVDVEVVGVVGQLARKGIISGAAADQAVAALAGMPLRRVLPVDLIAGAWERRHNLRAADAFFAATSDELDGPVVTLDAGLAAQVTSILVR